MLPSRVGLTYHLADRPGDPPADARMRVLRDGYIGIAPVPGGHGLTGMAERVERLGGSFHAGPAGRGWAVHATVPRQEQSA